MPGDAVIDKVALHEEAPSDKADEEHQSVDRAQATDKIGTIEAAFHDHADQQRA